MPPLRSPWEPMVKNNHKRGRSFESGLPLKSKDDDLVLFNEAQIHERYDFLLHPTDDFEDSISKLKHISDFKNDISILTGGEGSDLLDVESEKNDYDWLLTPPETPLFPTLDDEDSQSVNLVSDNVQRSHPIPILKLGTEMSCQASQSNYSPQILNPCSRSSSALSQTRGRSSSSQQSSPHSIIQRSFTPPNRASAPLIRATTPTLRRMSTGSNIQASSYERRGASPVKSSRGYSYLPKSQERQITLPSLISERPPKMRTSLLDQPVLSGSSLTSRNRRESLIKQRGLMSPTRSRGIMSSHSHEKNHYNSYSKGSSTLDVEESVHSTVAGIYKSTSIRKEKASMNGKSVSYIRNQSRAVLSNPVPIRSFDSALRLMDQHKMPQSMFRPLLSSVPATTLRPIFSKNSSLTSSSNASSEQGVSSAAFDMVGGELEQKDAPDEWNKAEEIEEIFSFDKANQTNYMNDEALSGKHQGYDDSFEISRKKVISEDIANHSAVFDGAERTFNLKPASQCAMAVCYKCGKDLNIVNAIGIRNICEECVENGIFITKSALTCIPFNENEVAPQMSTVVMPIDKERLFNSEMREFSKDDNEKGKLDYRGSKINLVADLFLSKYPLQNQNESQLSDQYNDTKRDLNIPHRLNHSVNPNLNDDLLKRAGVIAMHQHESIEACAQLDLNKKKTLSAESNDDNCDKNASLDNCDATNIYKPRRNKNEFEEKDGSFTEALGCEMIPKIFATEEHNNLSHQLNLKSTPLFSLPMIYNEDSLVQFDNCMTVTCCESQDLSHQTNNDLSHSLATVDMIAEECASLNIDEDHQNNESEVQNGESASDIKNLLAMNVDQFMMNHTFQNSILDASNNSSSSVGIIESQDGSIEIEERKNVCMYSHKLPPFLEHSKKPTMRQTSENGIPIAAVHENELFARESTIKIESPKGRQSKKLSLDEATDTILFCSSIIHDIAYEATAISMGKNQEAHQECYAPPPKVTILEKTTPGLWEESLKLSSKYPQRSQNTSWKKMDALIKSPMKELEQENDIIIKDFTTIASRTAAIEKFDSFKEPKLESKCYCSVM